MIPSAFKYQRAASIDQAIATLASDPEAKLLLGGHSLIPLMKLRLARPSQVVDVSSIPELRTTQFEADSIRVGAGVRYHEILADGRLDDLMPLLSQTVAVIADPQVRHRGTIGGSAAHADPTSDLAAVFLAADARFVVRGTQGERIIPAADWYLAPLVTALSNDEVLVAVEFSRALPLRQAYVKFAHPASGYALAGVAALLEVSQDGRVTRAQIGVTGAGVMPFRAREAEAILEGQPLDVAHVGQACEAGAASGEYADDAQYSAAYRKNLARVMIGRALEKVAADK